MYIFFKTKERVHPLFILYFRSDTVDFEPKEDNATVVDGTSEKQNHVLDNNANIHEQEKSDHVFNVGLLPPWAKKQVMLFILYINDMGAQQLAARTTRRN